MKRPIDFVLALIALVVLSPVLFATSILVRIFIGSPAVYMQKRPGKDEKIFTLYKFRTMNDKRDENGELLPDGKRLTKLGRILRSTSLDELPQLINILKGDLSIVGPRPQLIKDMVFMSVTQRKRHMVRQGLTGLAQVNGRNDITWEEKFDYDLQYIRNITFFGDIKIILLTAKKVFEREGINSAGSATCEDFGDYLLNRKKIDKDEYLRKTEESKLIENSL
ncbi:MAG: sugar transferase [Clostridiales bacterium]|nr:sugar transferase [Clostridiales bacterium]